MTDSGNSPSRTPERNVSFGSPTHTQDQWVMKSVGEVQQSVRDLRAEAIAHAAKMDGCLTRLEGSVSKLDRKLDKKLDAAMDKIELKLDSILTRHEGQITAVHVSVGEKITPIETRLTSIEKLLSKAIWAWGGMMLAATIIAIAYSVFAIFFDVSITPKPPVDAAVSAAAE